MLYPEGMAGEFLPFPKLPCRGSADADVWVALEKIHGAHLVMDVDARTVRFGKRKGWLQENEPFFGWQLLRGALRESARKVFDQLDADRVVLYGELFGGGYPHPQVADKGLTPVQTGVWYSPDLRWALFEVRADDEYLSWSECQALASKAGIVTPPVIARGKKAEIDALPDRFPSRLAVSLGLPLLGDGNLAEGLVVKPDARMAAAIYASSKRKIAEMREARFDESQPWNPDRPMGLPALADWAERLTNGPRLAAAASKVGRHDTGALADEVVIDVLLDLEEAFPGAMSALEHEGWAALESAIRTRVAASPA
jgi:Rnl2 family RNA ligase